MATTFHLGEIADKIGAQLHGDADCAINAIRPLQSAKAGDLSFLNNPKYQKFLSNTRASAVILSPEAQVHCRGHALVMDNPYVGYAKAATLFATTPLAEPGIHSSAVVADKCQIDPAAQICANAVIGLGVVIGARSIIGAGCVISDNVSIGEDTILYPNVTIYHQVRIGSRVVINSGAVIGADGFGIAKHEGQWLKIPQLGTVVLEDDVEIGANTTIDRGALDDTVIGRGVKLDNQIQVGHNVTIGENTAIAACSGISGSVDIGKNCMISGMVGFTGHFKVADNVMITGQTMVSKGIDKPGVYSSGTVMEPHASWKKNAVRFRQLDDLAKRINQLEKQLTETTKEPS